MSKTEHPNATIRRLENRIEAYRSNIDVLETKLIDLKDAMLQQQTEDSENSSLSKKRKNVDADLTSTEHRSNNKIEICDEEVKNTIDHLKYKAGINGLTYAATEQRIKSLVSQPCEFCGRMPHKKYGSFVIILNMNYAMTDENLSSSCGTEACVGYSDFEDY